MTNAQIHEYVEFCYEMNGYWDKLEVKENNFFPLLYPACMFSFNRFPAMVWGWKEKANLKIGYWCRYRQT